MTRTKKQTHNGDERAALILELFRQLPDNKFSLRHLASASGGASKEGRRETMQIVEQLLATGVIESCPRDKYRLSPAQRPRLEGTVEMLNTGSMFVHVEGMEQQVYIHSRNSLNALDGDRVQLVLTRKARGSNAPEGEITAIVERSRKRYVGTAEVNEHNVFVRIDSRKMPVDVYLHKRDCPNVKNGDKVVVRIAEWAPGSKSPVGELVDILGKAGENDTEMHAILAEYDLPYRFEPEVEAAAEAIDGRITCKDYAERRDFRQTVTFTVDPADAKDFDDALSVRKVRDGVWEVGVHIADVTHYVRPGSVVDTEAEARGTSVYLVDRTVPMLPERLCNELCSLRPHEESLCFSAVFTLNENLEILDEWFGRTVIYSDRRFAYEEAQQVIETGRGDYAEEILTLNRLAQAMRRERFRNGAISFDRAEAKFRLDEKGRPVGVYFKEQKEANQMIEEFMLLANRRVAEFCSESVDVDDWDLKGLRKWVAELTGRADLPSLPENGDQQEIVEVVGDYVGSCYKEKSDRLSSEIIQELSAQVMLRVIDTRWMAYLQEMDYLKTGIGLRGFGQRDPLVEYKTEAYAAFTELVNTMYEDFLRTILRIELARSPEPTEDDGLRGAKFSGPAEVDGDQGGARAVARAPQGGMAVRGRDGKSPAASKPSTYRKSDDPDPYVGIGRNDPCPCGSGKKFKNCHGRNR